MNPHSTPINYFCKFKKRLYFALVPESQCSFRMHFPFRWRQLADGSQTLWSSKRGRKVYDEDSNLDKADQRHAEKGVEAALAHEQHLKARLGAFLLWIGVAGGASRPAAPSARRNRCRRKATRCTACRRCATCSPRTSCRAQTWAETRHSRTDIRWRSGRTRRCPWWWTGLRPAACRWRPWTSRQRASCRCRLAPRPTSCNDSIDRSLDRRRRGSWTRCTATGQVPHTKWTCRRLSSSAPAACRSGSCRALASNSCSILPSYWFAKYNPFCLEPEKE